MIAMNKYKGFFEFVEFFEKVCCIIGEYGTGRRCLYRRLITGRFIAQETRSRIGIDYPVYQILVDHQKYIP